MKSSSILGNIAVVDLVEAIVVVAVVGNDEIDQRFDQPSSHLAC